MSTATATAERMPKKENKAYQGRCTMAEIRAMKNDPEAKFTLSLQEAARVPGVSTKHLRQLAKAGKVPGARQIGREWRFSTLPLIAWVEGEL